jgi:hypothetical protein
MGFIIGRIKRDLFCIRGEPIQNEVKPAMDREE